MGRRGVGQRRRLPKRVLSDELIGGAYAEGVVFRSACSRTNGSVRCTPKALLSEAKGWAALVALPWYGWAATSTPKGFCIFLSNRDAVLLHRPGQSISGHDGNKRGPCKIGTKPFQGKAYLATRTRVGRPEPANPSLWGATPLAYSGIGGESHARVGRPVPANPSLWGATPLAYPELGGESHARVGRPKPDNPAVWRATPLAYSGIGW